MHAEGSPQAVSEPVGRIRAQRPRFLANDTTRAWTAAIMASVLTAAALLATLFWVRLTTFEIIAIGVVMCWALMALLHVVFMFWTFGRADRAALEAEFARTREARSAAPNWSMQLSLMTVIVLAILIAVPALRTQPITLGLGLAMVGSVWASVMLTYAVHYARTDLAAAANGHPELGFPGDADRSFSDYLYMSAMIQATFGTTDVEVRSTAMRRTVTGQAVLAFVFNTGIIAVVISLVLAV